MSRRLSMLLLSTWLTVPGLAPAGELTPEQIARIRRDEKAALERVNAAHGNRKSSEMDNAERRQVIQEQQEAIQGVLDKHGASRKDYARQTATMGPKGNEAVEAAAKELEAKDQAAAAGKTPQGQQEPGDIQVQQGFSDENPVTMEEKEGAGPTVEVGIPQGEEEPAGQEAPAVEN
ncbi:MAG TPA: hypothetical protein VF794_25435 [Archangium sp.]|uniref:hypothetical protein n=1 Tax=Archangium sp. TaxID=1872627 RepID=UPI002ED967B3